MSFLSIPAGALMAMFLVSCGTSDPGPPTMASAGPGFPSGSAAWSEKERSTYKAAYDAGRRDQVEGYRFDDDRLAMPMKEEMRSFARQGYRYGYYSGNRQRHSTGGSSGAGTALEPLAPSPGAGFSLPAPPAPEPVKPPAKPRGPDPLDVHLEPLPMEQGAGGQ